MTVNNVGWWEFCVNNVGWWEFCVGRVGVVLMGQTASEHPTVYSYTAVLLLVSYRSDKGSFTATELTAKVVALVLGSEYP